MTSFGARLATLAALRRRRLLQLVRGRQPVPSATGSAPITARLCTSARQNRRGASGLSWGA
eukprot:9423520-Pyramimonas_sp.AAC.1